MKTIEEIKAKAAADIAEAERVNAIAKQLSVAPRHILFAFGGKTCIYYQAKTLAEALAILRAFEPAPFAEVRNGWLSYRPREWFSTRDLAGASSIVDINTGGTVLGISGGKGFGPEAKLTRWTVLPSGEVAQVSVSLGVYPSGEGFPHQWYVRSAVEYDRSGEVKSARHDAPRITSDLSMVTRGGGSRDAYSFEWIWTETATFDNEMARYT